MINVANTKVQISADGGEAFVPIASEEYQKKHPKDITKINYLNEPEIHRQKSAA
jgi:hypothetical protein